MLLIDCYEECKSYLKILNEKNVNEYTIPKMDFNSTNPEIITNLKNGQFTNENIIMDLVKNGEIAE